DIERVVSRVDGVRDGQCVAFSRLGGDGAEIAVVVAESRKNTAGLADAIIAAVRAELGLTVTEVCFIKRGTLPKTSSGKVRRRECRRRLDAAELELVGDGDSESFDSEPTTMPPRGHRPVALQGAPHGIQ